MQPTRLRTLALAALLAAAAGYVLFQLFDAYADAGLPDLSWLTPGVLAFVAALIALRARTARGWIQERRFDRTVDALTVARMVAVAKAAALFGALAAGLYLGFAIYAFVQLDSPAGRHRALVAACTVLVSAAMVGSALWLERCCRVPPGRNGEPPGSPTTPGTTAL